jgi:hypothetical protein
MMKYTVGQDDRMTASNNPADLTARDFVAIPARASARARDRLPRETSPSLFHRLLPDRSSDLQPTPGGILRRLLSSANESIFMAALEVG